MTRDLNSKARLLAYITVGYNILEGIVSVFVGSGVDSSALIGFGLDSFVESLSGVIIIWRFSVSETADSSAIERREHRAVTLVSYTFFALGAYALLDAARDFFGGEAPRTSLIGIAIAVISIIVMPLLFWLKWRLSVKLDSHSLRADSKQTLACMLLSVGLLLGLSLNYLLNIWWADSLAGLLIGFYLIREGFQTYRTRKLCAC